MLQSAPDDPKPNSRNRASKIPYICALQYPESQIFILSLHDQPFSRYSTFQDFPIDFHMLKFQSATKFLTFQLCLTVSAELKPWCRHPSSVRKMRFLRNRQVNYVMPNFVERQLSGISRAFFCFKKNLDFRILMIFFVLVNMGPYGSENFKTLLLPQL